MATEYTVIVVDEEPTLDRYERWLSTSYGVERTTDDGVPDADLEDVDVVLSTPPYPRINEPTGTVPARDVDRGCLVLVASGFDRNGSVLDCASSASVARPLDRRTLRDTVSRQLERARYDDLLAEYADLAAKQASLEASGDDTIRQTDEYAALNGRIDDVETELDAITDAFDVSDFDAAFETPDFAGESRLFQAVWTS